MAKKQTPAVPVPGPYAVLVLLLGPAAPFPRGVSSALALSSEDAALARALVFDTMKGALLAATWEAHEPYLREQARTLGIKPWDNSGVYWGERYALKARRAR